MKTKPLAALLLLISVCSFKGLFGQYSFNMTPLSGAYGTYVTFTGSSFIKGKTRAFLGDKELKVIYATNLHLVVRIPKGARTGFITIKNNPRLRGFKYPKMFIVKNITGNPPANKGLYVSLLDTDEGEGNIYLYKTDNDAQKVRVFHRSANPVNYRKILSIACGNIDASLDYKIVYSVAKKPYENNVPETALYIGASPFKLDEASVFTKRVFGYSRYNEISSLFIAPLEGDDVKDLIYCQEYTEAKTTTLFRKIASMPRDVPLFSVPSRFKIKLICPVDFENLGQSKIALAYFDNGMWHLGVLNKITSFKSKSIIFKSKYRITAITGSSNKTSSAKIYFAIKKNNQVAVFAVIRPGRIIKVYSKEIKGTITSLALADLDNNNKDELYIGLYSDSHASLIQIKNPLSRARKEKTIFRKFERIITALSKCRY